MIIGILKEIKEEEYRVGILPKTVKELVKKGHKVLVEKNAGIGAGIKDEDYEKEGAEIVEEHSYIFKNSELIIKVKEPLPSEYELLQEGQIIFTFFHFPSNQKMTENLIKKKVTCIAYELVEEDGILVILKPMSEIAGKLSIQQGMKYLEKEYGGKGVLLSGAEGVNPGKVLILGGGTVGYNAAKIAYSIGADITIIEKNEEKIKFLKKEFPEAKVFYSEENVINEEIKYADVINCVPNIPGVVPKTSTYALCNKTKKYILQLAEYGLKATEMSYGLKTGLAIKNGDIVNPKLNVGPCRT